jgi:hypothetical protein
MCLQDYIEAETIAGVPIIGMVALDKIWKHPLDRARMSVRADFQDFVVVDELRDFHHIPAI